MIYQNNPQLTAWLLKDKREVLAGQKDFVLNDIEFDRHFKAMQSRPERERHDAAAFCCLTWDDGKTKTAPVEHIGLTVQKSLQQFSQRQAGVETAVHKLIQRAQDPPELRWLLGALVILQIIQIIQNAF